jgi:Invasion associated locus B (IalB) protein
MSAPRLFRVRAGPISARMNTRFACCLSLALMVALPAGAVETKKTATAAPAAAHATPAGPKSIGKFDDWTAATHQEAGAPVCYAFARVQSSAPALTGRGPVVLTVTQRASGRDAVAIEAGFAYAPNATVTVQVDQAGLEFYTAGRNAFARDGKAAVAAFGKGSRAIARSPAPKEVTDTFSLKGFGDAYKAIVKACPAK